MKNLVGFILAAGIGFAIGGWIVSKQRAAQHARQLAAQQEAWEAERAQLEAALADAQNAARAATPLPSIVQPAVGPACLSPAEIITKLQALRSGPGATSPRSMRQAVYWFAELTQAGPAALPAIREFLARNEDLDLDVASFTAGRGNREVRVPLDFVVPPSLRFGLFDVARQIGGRQAEEILSEALARTGRGIEVSFLARVLDEIAPGVYRNQALTVARDLLISSGPLNPTSPLDRSHRENLYGVLTLFNDASFASTAQSQLLQPDGQIDRNALKYLQQTLGPQSVAIAAQAYQDPRVTDSAKKEPLARLALNFVGPDNQANEFYQRAINDPVLTASHRKNLIEDLNQDGFADTRNLAERDLPLINTRMQLIEQLAPNAMDPVNAAAFKEAYKDLVNMRAAAMKAQLKPQ